MCAYFCLNYCERLCITYSLNLVEVNIIDKSYAFYICASSIKIWFLFHKLIFTIHYSIILSLVRMHVSGCACMWECTCVLKRNAGLNRRTNNIWACVVYVCVRKAETEDKCVYLSMLCTHAYARLNQRTINTWACVCVIHFVLLCTYVYAR